ncbi:hypothetical protein J2X56_001182 [Herbaspirillum sp. 1173]|nr:hypothetical protein [Herbaspirillum sp. 1173]
MRGGRLGVRRPRRHQGSEQQEDQDRKPSACAS